MKQRCRYPHEEQILARIAASVTVDKVYWSLDHIPEPVAGTISDDLTRAILAAGSLSPALCGLFSLSFLGSSLWRRCQTCDKHARQEEEVLLTLHVRKLRVAFKLWLGEAVDSRAAAAQS